MKTSGVWLISLVALIGCESAANLGDEALRRGSFDRITATPFTHFVDTQSCKETLTPTFGIQHRSLEVQNGVQVSQSFACEGSQIVAKVSLKNHNPSPMYCFTVSDNQETGAWVGPNGLAFYEYAFQFDASHFCSKNS